MRVITKLGILIKAIFSTVSELFLVLLLILMLCLALFIVFGSEGWASAYLSFPTINTNFLQNNGSVSVAGGFVFLSVILFIYIVKVNYTTIKDAETITNTSKTNE